MTYFVEIVDMSLFELLVVGFGAVLVVWLVASYFRRSHDALVEARENCETAWSNVEVLLQRRYDEVGNLIDIASEYMDMERDVLAGVVEARESTVEASTPAEAAEAEVEIRESVREFYSLAEEMPKLRTDEKFADVRDSLREIEQRLENRREYYNDAVRSGADCLGERLDVVGNGHKRPLVAGAERATGGGTTATRSMSARRGVRWPVVSASRAQGRYCRL